MWWYGSLSVSRLNLAILFIKWLRRLNDKNDLLKYICRVCSDSVVCFVWNEITSILYLFYNQTAIANQVLTFLCSYFLSAWTPALFIQGELVELICDMIYSYEWSFRAFPSVSSNITRCLSYSICSFSVCKLLLCLYIHGSKTHNFIKIYVDA